MLLDEVTSALDPELVGEVLATVRALKEEGVTMLIATHEMGFAREVADKVCFLHEGRMLEVGPPEQVLDDPQRARDPALPAPAARGGPSARIRPWACGDWIARRRVGDGIAGEAEVKGANAAPSPSEGRGRSGRSQDAWAGGARVRQAPLAVDDRRRDLALVVVRVLIDEPLTWRDAVAVGAMLVVYPFGEWAIHVYLLHAKPIERRGQAYELPTTRDHRYHHRHPTT